jgi:hypothetical protein
VYGTGTYEILSAEATRVDQGKWMNVSKKTLPEAATRLSPPP